MTRKVVSPIALDKSINTTEQTPRNIADVLAQQLAAIKTAIESGNGNLEAAFVCYYGVTTATQIKEAIEDGKVPYFYYNGAVAQLWKVETDKYTFRTTNTRSVEGQTILDVVDYVVNGSVWSTITREVSGGSSSGQSYIASVNSLADFDTTGHSGMHSVLSVNNVPADGIYQLSVMLHITPKTASATKSDLVFGFYGSDGIGMIDHTFHAVVDDSQTFAQQLSFSTTLNLKAGANSLKLSCDGLNTNYLVFVDDLTVAQLVNGVYHNGDDFSDVHTLPEAPDFNNDDGVLVDGATGSPRFMLWRTLANKVLGFIKSLSTTITAFRTGDVIAVDGPSGTAKMPKDNLLKETAQNTDTAMSEKYDLESIDFGVKKSEDITATSGSQIYRFELFALSLNIGDKYLIKLNESTNCVSSFAIGSLGNNNTWTRNSAYVPADNQWHEVEVIETNAYDGKCGVYIPPDRVIANGVVSMEICTKYGNTLKFQLSEDEKRITALEHIDHSGLSATYQKSIDMSVTSGSQLYRFELFTKSLNIGDKALIRLVESTNCVSSFAIGSLGNNNTWTCNSNYAAADGQWHEVNIIATNTYDGKCGIYVPPDRVIGNGVVSMEVRFDYQNTIQSRLNVTEKKVDDSSINEITTETLTSATKTMTSGTQSLEFALLNGTLRTGEIYKIRMVDPSNSVRSFSLASFGDNGAWTHNSSPEYVPADGDWHEVTIVNGNAYNDKFGWWIPSDRVIGNGPVHLEIQMNYENTLMYKVAKNTSDIANLQQSSLIKQFDGILKTDESEPLTSVSQSDGLAGIFPKFGFIGDSLCSGAVAYNDGTWHYPERYYTSWGLYMCRKIGSNGTIWAYSGCTTASWWNSYITLATRGYNNEGVQDDNARFSSLKIGYVIALGTNDANASATVGDVDTDIDIADYNNNADTFAGRYARIIQKIKEQQPSAKIFVVTLPTIWQSQAESLGYNDVIRAMATKFTNVFVIDFQKYLPSGTKVSSDYVYQGHMTTQGYKWISMAMATYIDYIVRTTPSSFKNVALIGHSSDHGQY